MKMTAMKKTYSRVAGFSLLEVMIAVVVLAFGLVSLAALQGRLFQSGAESKARAAATNIGQQVLEDARSFAFVTPPATGGVAYSGPTYDSLATTTAQAVSVGGVDYTVTKTVTRYCANGAGQFTQTCPGTASAGTPEFKLVNVTVGWTGSDGATKSVQLTDSIAAVAPADAIHLGEEATNSNRSGPQVYIVPPNQSNPAVVPIATGNDQSSASSNPTPDKFAKSGAAITRFSVMNFTGDANSSEVLLNRKTDVSVATCTCASTGTSTATNPAYQMTVWNGAQQAYVDPQPLPAGAAIGLPQTANADPTPDPTCTVCCRDHHENAQRQKPTYVRPDPWRLLTSAEANGKEHYQTNGTTQQTGTGAYIDSCQIIRVNGLLRVAVDAQQSDLLVAPLNSAGTGYENTSFASQYGTRVQTLLGKGVASLDSGYPAPDKRFQTFRLGGTTGSYDETGLNNPRTPGSSLVLSQNQTRQLVAFGLYVDYLSPETQALYLKLKNLGCDANPQPSGCNGITPMQALPFYAVNVASLGTWSVTGNFTVSNLGLVKSTSAAPDADVNLSMRNSNSGLAVATVGSNGAVDPDDASPANTFCDKQRMRNGPGGSAPGACPGAVTVVLTVAFDPASIITVDGGFTMTVDNVNSQFNNGTAIYAVTGASPTVSFSNYADDTTDSKVCLIPGPGVTVTSPLVETGTGAGKTATAGLSVHPVNGGSRTVKVVAPTDICP
jgi:Tfp pilus assembly protein PilV